MKNGDTLSTYVGVKMSNASPEYCSISSSILPATFLPCRLRFLFSSMHSIKAPCKIDRKTPKNRNIRNISDTEYFQVEKGDFCALNFSFEMCELALFYSLNLTGWNQRPRHRGKSLTRFCCCCLLHAFKCVCTIHSLTHSLTLSACVRS